MMLTTENIIAALSGVTLPGAHENIIAAGMISEISIQEGKIGFLITISGHHTIYKEWLQTACEQAVKALPGVKSVMAVMTAENLPPTSPVLPLRKAVWNTNPLEHVTRIIAVASGKGGVGKSTTAVNLAHAFTTLGHRAGLLDADIYGPSIPRMMGISGKPDVQEGKIIPLMAYGIRCISMGLLIEQDAAVVWRGPQMSKALHQLLRGVEWGTKEAPLDVLIIDMPPGTGDIHLSLVQQVPVNGAVIVTTPQEVAVADARKCIDMFRKVNVRILGIIENMSGFTDPAGITHAIFAQGGGEHLAQSQKVPFLGQIPIYIELREASDSGKQFEDKTVTYKAIARKLYE